jgi:hypothetical protein
MCLELMHFFQQLSFAKNHDAHCLLVQGTMSMQTQKCELALMPLLTDFVQDWLSSEVLC